MDFIDFKILTKYILLFINFNDKGKRAMLHFNLLKYFLFITLFTFIFNSLHFHL